MTISSHALRPRHIANITFTHPRCHSVNMPTNTPDTTTEYRCKHTHIQHAAGYHPNTHLDQLRGHPKRPSPNGPNLPRARARVTRTHTTHDITYITRCKHTHIQHAAGYHPKTGPVASSFAAGWRLHYSTTYRSALHAVQRPTGVNTTKDTKQRPFLRP